MSDGPIKQWRDSFKTPRPDVKKSDLLHTPTVDAGRAHCGRRGVKFAASWPDVTCPDCHAAHRADRDVA